MAIEIERKFLVKNKSWQVDQQGNTVNGIVFRQGYLVSQDATVRVRLEGEKAVLTLKGKTEGVSRLEYEYEIPASDANEMLDKLCEKPLIEKTRYKRVEGNLVWEIDVFEAENSGLIVAEVELDKEDQQIDMPAWAGEEVSGDPKYYNVNLVKAPYSSW